ncbi:uncharacterized protein EURHEDRAFT_398832 [Aspergillus ruber CBS 135680]|uniref:Uncharacterized protein n=1 Tax=Aspergillus ruber (strain CBS 135680) TaxID=1388766 RepID=A0A017SRS8_ASPRC|nr:uncharacterized protein EURHEDRAFT_398832 [Aspergillus ruber CBS 135680]EYE99663.1 hypothetical protein EURHEDRAFT_398832 [Aspergillus ruber CBS 135680]
MEDHSLTMYGQPALGSALEVCEDLELFEKLDTAGKETMDMDELAALLDWHILDATMSKGCWWHKVIATSRNPSSTPDLVVEIEGNGGKWVHLDVDSAQCGYALLTTPGAPSTRLSRPASRRRFAPKWRRSLTKVLTKEIAPFNIRTLTVILGTFNTNMPDSVALGETPLPDDYKGTVTEQVQGLLSNGKTIPNCDKDKAMKALGANLGLT